MMIALGCLLALGLSPEEIADNRMTTAGWFVMTISIGAVLALLSYCLYMTFSLPSAGQGPSEQGPSEQGNDEELTRPTIDSESDQ